LTAEEYELAQKDIARKRRTEKPQRSRVAPVSRERSDDFSDDIKNLLAGLEPKITSEVISKAASLGNLPPAQQTLLRCALAAASETFKKAEVVEDELARVKERQRRAETDLVAESQALGRRSAVAEAQVASLREDLAASVEATYARESRSRKHRLWLTLGAVVSVGAACVFFLSHPAIPVSPVPETDPSVSAGSPSESDTAVPTPPRAPARPLAMPHPVPRAPIVQQAFNRLDRALNRVPLPEVDAVLREANLWLMASGISPCTLRLAEGETALLVGGKSKRTAGPLTAALARCAEAVEHVTE
jgi:hypothetical protein